MNDSKPATQRLLFECDRPHWNRLPSEQRQELLEVLSQILLDALEPRNDSISSATTAEDGHVS